MPRVLILKFGAIGDVIMAIPGARQLHLQGSEIDWVCGATVLPILELYPWINPIVIDDRALLTGGAAAKFGVMLKLWRRLAGCSYDLAATLYYDPRYRFLTLPVRAGRKIQLSRTDRLIRLLPGRHHTDEYARILLGWPDEVRPQPLAPVVPDSLPPSPLARTTKPRVVLAPAGAKNMMNDDKLRRWQPENYVALAVLLIERGVEAVLIGGPGDAWIQPQFAPLGVTDLIGKLTLPQTLGLLDEADILVTHDTGPLHLAGITRAGIVTIFGPTDPRGRLPQRPGTLALWGGEGFACRPCYDGYSFAPCPANDCMAQVTPAMALEEVLKMIADRAAGTLASPRVVTPASTVSSARLITIGAGSS
jgi:heptosyltransferase-2